MNAVALFSGGKDSLYAVYLAEKQGVTVDHLLTLLPTLPWPSPHAENIDALKILADSMGKCHTIVDFKKENAFVEALESLEVDALIAGDINVEAHLAGLMDVCKKTGLELLEPIYGRDTSELFSEIFGLGFKALITGVNLKYLGKSGWASLSVKNLVPIFCQRLEMLTLWARMASSIRWFLSVRSMRNRSK
jgi:diphthine-ammonia ligase